MRTQELRRKFRLANTALAVTTPVLVIATVVLKVIGASDGVLQALGILYFFSNFAILWALDSRYERHHRLSRETEANPQ